MAADTAGNIAAVVATKVPAREPGRPFNVIATQDRSDRDFQAFFGSADLPSLINPEQNYFASANNHHALDGAIPFGGVFVQDERLSRLDQRLSRLHAARLDDLTAIQRDVVSPASRGLMDILREDLEALALSRRWLVAVRDVLLTWDGSYGESDVAPAVFESLLTALAPAVYTQLSEAGRERLYGQLGRLRIFVGEDFARLDSAARRIVLVAGLRNASRTLRWGTTWADLHRLRIEHILGRIPLIGGRYRIEMLPLSGSRETMFKTAHPTTDKPHLSFFGAQSHHLSDLSDLDANTFVILGGQDGWIGSDTFADQVDLWRKGETVHVPLAPKAVRDAFPIAMRLRPGS